MGLDPQGKIFTRNLVRIIRTVVFSQPEGGKRHIGLGKPLPDPDEELRPGHQDGDECLRANTTRIASPVVRRSGGFPGSPARKYYERLLTEKEEEGLLKGVNTVTVPGGSKS